VACCLTDPPVVAYLRALYEHRWGNARPLFDERDEGTQDTDLDEIQRAILAFLHEGLSHQQIGRRLDLNERTVAARIAQLKEKFEVTSLFQLGAEAARRGLL
jgi:DNA-binding NarL/FixJ family response regulator